MEALHTQIVIAPQNHRLYIAEIIITEAVSLVLLVELLPRDSHSCIVDQAIDHCEAELSSSHHEPSLLQSVLAREDTHKAFRDFAYRLGAQRLFDIWMQCDLLRRNCLHRENDIPVRTQNVMTPREEWGRLCAIITAAEQLPMIDQKQVLRLRALLQSEELKRGDDPIEYPRSQWLEPLLEQMTMAIENGPLRHFVMSDGYRMLLGSFMGRIV